MYPLHCCIDCLFIERYIQKPGGNITIDAHLSRVQERARISQGQGKLLCLVVAQVVLSVYIVCLLQSQFVIISSSSVYSFSRPGRIYSDKLLAFSSGCDTGLQSKCKL